MSEEKKASTARTFSEASFYSVLTAYDEGPIPATPPSPLPPSSVIAFYGYRGGTGRTTALAYAAALLAERMSWRIGVIDLDVEAPGLQATFGIERTLPEDRGMVALIRKALTHPAGDSLQADRHLIEAPIDVAPGKLYVLPAGEVSRRYLAQVEELGVGLWHVKDENPIVRVIDDLRETADLDLVMIDCRTGFNSLAASILFHVADLNVVFFSLTPQIWGGIEVLLEATKAARAVRGALPRLIFVPSMVPAGKAGRDLCDTYLQTLGGQYERILGPVEVDEDDEDPDRPTQPWLEEGVNYDGRIAVAESVERRHRELASVTYRPLADAIVRFLGGGAKREDAGEFDAAEVLGEIEIKEDEAFGELPDYNSLLELFVAPQDFQAAVDPATSLVVGAKGSGKTVLWRYMAEGGGAPSFPLPAGMAFVVGNGPAGVEKWSALQLSASGFTETEKAAGLRRRETHKSFWIASGIARICHAYPEIHQALVGALSRRGTALIRKVIGSRDAGALQDALIRYLKSEQGRGTQAERLLEVFDGVLLDANRNITLIYDGLDTGFQTGTTRQWYDRRSRFVTALLQLVAEWRTRLRRLHFKVLLREDIWIGVEMQNRSHLEATKQAIRWTEADLWKMALNIAARSPTYRGVMSTIMPGVDKPWSVPEEDLKRLLFPFWGERIESGKAAYTANYIAKRTRDAADRLFPRTLIQLIAHAIKSELQEPDAGPRDRVLRRKAIKHGVEHASGQRVVDLMQEYVEIKPFLEALQGTRPTGTIDDFIKVIRKNISQSGKRPVLIGGSYKRVVEMLVDVGVLGPYRGTYKSQGDRLAVALMYRKGLGVHAFGA